MSALVVEVPRSLVGAVVGIVVLGVVVCAAAWATRDRPDDDAVKTAVVAREHIERGALLPSTRVMHPERGLGTIGGDPPLAGGLFPVLFDRDHPRRVRWEPRLLLSPVTPADERHLADIERRGVAVFRPPAPRGEPARPAPCIPTRSCSWHNPDDCEVVACCESCPTSPHV